MKPFLAALISALFLTACSQAPVVAVDRTPATTATTAITGRTLGPGEYLVKRGDTLFRIAREHGLNHQELAALNNIDNPSSLREGQILLLRPSTASVAPAPAAGVVATPVGVAAKVETRSLDAEKPVPTAPVGAVREPRGGKEPYSDEAYARLNRSEPAKLVTSAAPPAVVSDKGIVEGINWAWPTSAKIKTAYSASGNKGVDFSGKLGDPVNVAADGKVLYVGDALAGYGKLIIVKHSTDHLSVYAHNSKVLVREAQSLKQGQKIAEMGSTGTDSVKLHFEIRKQGKPVDPMPFLPQR